MMGLKTLSLSGKDSLSHPGYGQLIKDKNEILDLPKGFSYKIIGNRRSNVGWVFPSWQAGWNGYISFFQSKRDDSCQEP